MERLFITIYNLVKTFLKTIGSLFSDLKETIAGIVMMVVYKGTIEGAPLTDVSIIDWLITVGMFIIIWYGVIKIFANVIWKLLFGRPLEWKVGILEILFKKLRPVYLQKVADMTDEELEETTDVYVDKLHKIRQKMTKDNTRRCCGLEKIKEFAQSAFKKLVANKKTNAAIATVGAMVITGGAYFANSHWGLGLEETLGVNFIELLAAEAVATGLLVAPGIFGKGYETVDTYTKRVAQEKRAKVAKKVAKKEGKVVTPAKQAEKMAKKLHIPTAAALSIVQEQNKAKQEAIQAKNAAKEAITVEKLAKKLHIGVEQAKVIRAEQLKNN